MNAHAFLETDDARFRAAWEQLNQWRGYCVHRFAATEAALSHAIRTARLNDPGALVKRIEALGKRIAMNGQPAGSAKKLAKALDDLAGLVPSRNAIVHGHGAVSLDRHGDWVWTYRVPPQGKSGWACEGYFTAASAAIYGRELQALSQSIIDLLRIPGHAAEAE